VLIGQREQLGHGPGPGLAQRLESKYFIIFSLGNRWHTPHLLDRRSVCAEFDIGNGIFLVQLP
jgi:hypothetical protein